MLADATYDEPWKLKPILVPKPWGGDRLRAVGKQVSPGSLIGESWELAWLPGGMAETLEGRIADSVAESAGGHHVFLSEVLRSRGLSECHLLLKYLDARQHLSLQVHPSQAFAARYPAFRTKSESWYVLASEPDAVVYAGVATGVTADELAAASASEQVDGVLRTIPVTEGMCLTLPSGIVHALGAGVVVAEIQEASDTTFRLCDWTSLYSRKHRELHLRQALEACDLSLQATVVSGSGSDSREMVVGNPGRIVVKRYTVPALTSNPLTGFAVMCIEGSASVEGVRFARGDTLLLPNRECDVSSGECGVQLLCIDAPS